MNGHWWAVVAAWAATAVAAVLALVLGPADRTIELLTLLLTGAIVLAFVLQLVVADRVGFVARLTTSVCGSLAIMVIAGVVAALMA